MIQESCKTVRCQEGRSDCLFATILSQHHKTGQTRKKTTTFVLASCANPSTAPAHVARRMFGR